MSALVFANSGCAILRDGQKEMCSRLLHLVYNSQVTGFQTKV